MIFCKGAEALSSENPQTLSSRPVKNTHIVTNKGQTMYEMENTTTAPSVTTGNISTTLLWSRFNKGMELTNQILEHCWK